MKPEHYKYHLAIRLQGYDYSKPGIYFVTICAMDRIEIFGRINKAQTELSAIGLIADECWREMPNHFPNVSLMDYVIMPDHLHGLICLTEKEKGVGTSGKSTIYRASTGENSESFGKPTKGSIPTIIRTYKAAVTRAVNRKFPRPNAFVWQPGYYEHVIRDQDEIEYTINYIKFNPEEWEAERNSIL